MKKNEIETLYNKVKDKLTLLYKISDENDKIIKLAQTIDYFKNDKEGLQIIENGLDKINASINIIKRNGNTSLIEMIDNILKTVKK